MSNPEFTWPEAHDKKNIRFDYYAHLLGTDWRNKLHEKRAKKRAKNKANKQAKLVNNTVYYACRATVMYENITNVGLFQLGDRHSLVTATMSNHRSLGRIGRGRGQGLQVVDDFGVDRPGAANEEQPEIRDDSQDVSPFAFPRGVISAMDGACAQSRASPGSGSLDGGQDKEAYWFLSGQSNGDAQTTGNAQATPMQDTSPFITCIADIDQEAHRMVDVLWIAAQRYRCNSWGRSDGDYFVNTTPDPSSTISQWISYARGE